MKKVTLTVFLITFLLVAGIAQNVGIGTDAPISRLSVDRGIKVDQSNSGTFGSLASALTFGSDMQVGIASNRSGAGNVQNGMDLYTANIRRISITSTGNVGIGTTNPQYRLDVAGTARISSNLIIDGNLGIGITDPQYRLHTTVGYFTQRLGVGTIPNNNYALDLVGSTRLDGNVRVTGFLTSEDNIRVLNTMGIVRSNSSTQYKIVPFNLNFSINTGAGGSFQTGNISYGESFSSAPMVLVGQVSQAIGTVGTLAWLNIVPFSPGTSGTTFFIANTGNSNMTFSSITVRCLAIGPQ
ncbi:MAG TPA: hypothetical protein PKC39_14690 [Ferruginibacter sp.]|nr:hypothetical protein [Ferruginibacter sp.]HMP22204.1 hypothetical protein [Ferruginibacter sp.]